MSLEEEDKWTLRDILVPLVRLLWKISKVLSGVNVLGVFLIQLADEDLSSFFKLLFVGGGN